MQDLNLNLPDLDRILIEHHEKPDGTGYPKGLKGSQISPLGLLFNLSHQLSNIIIKDETKSWATIVDELKATNLDSVYKHYLKTIEKLKLIN